MNRKKSARGASVLMSVLILLGFLLLSVRSGSLTGLILSASFFVLILFSGFLSRLLRADRMVLTLTLFLISLGVMVRMAAAEEVTLASLLPASGTLMPMAESLLPAVCLPLIAFLLSRRQMLAAFGCVAVCAGGLYAMGCAGSAVIFCLVGVFLFWSGSDSPAGIFYPLFALCALLILLFTARPDTEGVLTVWRDPWAARETEAMLPRSLTMIASGGLFGIGPGMNASVLLSPDSPWLTFSAMAQQLGLIFACLILLLYGVLGLRGAGIASAARTSFTALSAMGASLMITFRCIVSAGGAMGLLPSAGLPMPFLSGGLSLFGDLVLAFIISHASSVNRRTLEEDAAIAMVAR